MSGKLRKSKLPEVVLATRSRKIDLECRGRFRLEAGKTYYNDGTTVFDVYIAEGIADGSLMAAEQRPDTIIVSYYQR